MATPKKNRDGIWDVVVYIGRDPKTGKKKYKHLTADTKPKLIEKMKKVEGESVQTIDALSITVGEAIDAYIERRESEISPSTTANYKKYRREAFPDLMNVKIGQLTDERCQQAIDGYAATRSPKTVVNRWNLLYAAVKEAKKNINISVKLPSVKRKRLNMPEEEPLQRLFKEIENTPLEIPVLLAAVCGLRRSEICALDYTDDIDYEKGIIRINKAIVMDEKNRYVLKDTKTTAGERAVPCPRWVLDKIEEAKNNPSQKRYAPNTITCKFTPIAKQCGVDCSFHGLRHYYASIMSALNIPEQYQMERMGHSTNYMLKRYQEYLKSKEAEVNEDLMQALDNLNPTSNFLQKRAQDNAKQTT